MRPSKITLLEVCPEYLHRHVVLIYRFMRTGTTTRRLPEDPVFLFGRNHAYSNQGHSKSSNFVRNHCGRLEV